MSQLSDKVLPPTQAYAGSFGRKAGYIYDVRTGRLNAVDGATMGGAAR